VDVLILSAKTAVACLLIVAGGAKLSDPASFASTVRLFIPFRVAWPLLSAIAVGISLGELAAGLASLTLPAIAALNVLVFTVACAFVAVSAVGYAFHRGRSCRCFGALSQRNFDAAGLLRSVVIAGIAAVALAHVGAPALQLDATARLLLLAAAGLLAVAAFTAARARGPGSEPEPEVVTQ
jgi:Methylamine utilisation protein MauE